MEKVIIESFTLDHTKVKAPYVRLIGQETGEHGDIVSNFDIRLCQPNQQEIPTGGMHTLEHLLALYLRPRIKGYLDCSPFGCRTGFHLLCWGVHDPKDVAKALKEALELVVKTTWERNVGTTRIIPCSVPRNGPRKFWPKESAVIPMNGRSFSRGSRPGGVNFFTPPIFTLPAAGLLWWSLHSAGW